MSVQQQSILKALGEQHLTSSQIVNRVAGVSLLLEVYPMLDALRKEGRIKSYNQGEIRYHCAA